MIIANKDKEVKPSSFHTQCPDDKSIFGDIRRLENS